MTKPTITVVIPAYNREKTILRSVKSVLSQTLPPDEIIVVDDGSSDRTVEFLEGLHEPSLKICCDSTNRGAQHARNCGIELASSDWVAFNDSDDFWLPRKLELQVKELEKTNYHPQVVLYSDMWLWSKNEAAFDVEWIRYPSYEGDKPLLDIFS
ncbi:MAG: glycosyltransferase, partial [Synergistaceae bacterium]|nr:glycosyltransferase [Synergistaceae bacterium]